MSLEPPNPPEFPKSPPLPPPFPHLDKESKGPAFLSITLAIMGLCACPLAFLFKQNWPTCVMASFLLCGLSVGICLRKGGKNLSTPALTSLLLSLLTFTALPLTAGTLFVSNHILNNIKKESPTTKIQQPNQKSPEKTLKVAIAPDPRAEKISQYKTSVKKLLEEKRFDEIEQIASKLRKTNPKFEKLPIWKMETFYEGLKPPYPPSDQTLKDHLATLAAWEKQHPTSLTPLNATAETLLISALKLGGGDQPNQMAPPTKALYSSQLQKAYDKLQKAKNQGPIDQQWYRLALKISFFGQLNPSTLTQISREGLLKHPEDYRLAQLQALALPKGEWESYASRLSNGSPLGHKGYAWIVIAQLPNNPLIFQESQARWDKTKAGLNILLKEYPDWVWLQNQAALLGSLASDREFAEEQLKKMGNKYLPDVWGSPEKFIAFQKWAEPTPTYTETPPEKKP